MRPQEKLGYPFEHTPAIWRQLHINEMMKFPNHKKLSRLFNMLRRFAGGSLRYAFIIGLLLSACAPALQPTNQIPLPTITPSPRTATATNVPALGAAHAAIVARQNLANMANLALDQVMAIDIQSVQWPDSCLGVHMVGQACAMHVVSGYQISLSANDQTYEAHTNQDSSQVVFVPGPIPPSSGITVVWHENGACQAAILTDSQGVSYGSCYGSLKSTSFVDSSQSQDLDRFLAMFMPFSTDTPAGYVIVASNGLQPAVASQQRSAAEWAKLAAEEAIAGQIDPKMGLALVWHETGGVANLCADLSVYLSGRADAISCQGGQNIDLGQFWLNDLQLNQLYQWVDSLKTFNITPSPTPSGPDELAVTLTLNGNGSTDATSADQQSIESFASQLYFQANNTASQQTDIEKASQVVKNFLDTLSKDPSGSSSTTYLSPSLQSYLNTGDSLTKLVGLQNMYASFSISGSQILADTGEVYVSATLNEATPVIRAFGLLQEDSTWLIEAIISYTVPTSSLPTDYSSADQVILKYYQALSTAQPSNAWPLLAPAEQNILPLGQLTTSIQGVQKMDSISIQLLSAAPDRLVYAVTLWVDTGQNTVKDWAQGKNQRWLELDKTDQGWLIGLISNNAIQ